MQRVAQIPGVGLLTATAAIATMGQAGAFKSGREFCAWLGLVPRQSGTGGKVKLLEISKRGDTYLRTLLIHGARSVLTHAKEPGPWLEQLKARRPANVVIVAQAAKMARAIWAVTAKQEDYQRGHRSVRPQAA
jgi:transposase